jgi:hypothetical protein
MLFNFTIFSKIVAFVWLVSLMVSIGLAFKDPIYLDLIRSVNTGMAGISALVIPKTKSLSGTKQDNPE